MKYKILTIFVSANLILMSLISNTNSVKALTIPVKKEDLIIKKSKYGYATPEQTRQLKINRMMKKYKEKKQRAALAAKLEKEKYINMPIPNHSSFKSYMPYTAITSKNSEQYKLQTRAYSDKNGLRKIDKYYLVAMGQYYGKVGDKFKVTLSSGQVFYAMIGDSKQFRHTGEGSGMIGADNKDMFEFIVDYSCLNSLVRKMGNVNVLLKGKVIKLQKEKE